jgi:hypothetical protein
MMSIRQLFERLLSGLVFLGLMIVVWAITPRMAAAQCGDYPPDSSCYTCHEETYPVFGKGEWHEIHARKDCCWNCHGGNTQTMDKDQTHLGMSLHPLEDTYTDCYACHPSDYQSRAERFGAILGVMPVGQEPTPQPSIPVAPDENLQLVILPASEPISAPAIPCYPELICLTLALAAFSAFLLWNKVHHRSSSLTS